MALNARVNWHHMRGKDGMLGMSLGYVDFDDEASLSFRATKEEYAFVTALSGCAHVLIGGEYLRLTQGRAVVITDADDVSMRMGMDFQLAILKVRRAVMEEMLGDLIHVEVEDRLRFERVLNLQDGYLQSWARTWELLLEELDTSHALINVPRRQQQYVNMLLEMLLSVHAHNYAIHMIYRDDEEPVAPDPADSRPSDYPLYLRKAVRTISEHPTWDFTSKSLADYVGIGERSLEHAFRKHLDVSPMAYLRNVRLDAARERLLAAPPEHTVIYHVARQMRFRSYSNFTRRYRQRFGERPSETLRRSTRTQQ